MDRFADIRIDAAALAHCLDDRCKVIIGQHHIRRALRHIGTGNTHGAADVGRLERRSVVDAVARHRHDLAALLVSLDDANLMLRRYPGKHRILVDIPFQVALFHLVQLLAGERFVLGAHHPQLPGNRDRRRHMVPGNHHSADSRFLAQAHRPLRFRTRWIDHPDKAAEYQVFLPLIFRRKLLHIAVGHAEHAQRARRHLLVSALQLTPHLLIHRGGKAAALAGGTALHQQIRRALCDDAILLIVEPVHRRHHLAGRLEGDFADSGHAALQLILRHGRSRQKCGLGWVALYFIARNGAVVAQRRQFQNTSGLGVLLCQHAVVAGYLYHRHLVLRERSCFIRADDAGAAERFHGWHAAHNGPAVCHAAHAHGQNDRDNRRQPLGNRGHRQADGNHEHIQRLYALDQPHNKDHRADCQRADAKHLARMGQTLLQGGLGRFFRMDHVGDFAYLCFHSGGHRHADTAPGRNAAAGIQHILAVAERRFIPADKLRRFFHRQGFAGQCGFLRTQVVRFQNAQIGRYKIALRQKHDIAGNDLFRGDFDPLAVAHHNGFGRSELFQRIDRLFGAALLCDTDHRIDDDDKQNDDGVYVITVMPEQGGKKRNCRGNQQDNDHKVFELLQKLCDEARPFALPQFVLSVFSTPLFHLRYRKPPLGICF